MGTFGRKSCGSIKKHGFYHQFNSSFLILYYLISSLSPWPNLFSLQMSPLTLIKLFLGSVFKREGCEEKEQLSVAKEGGAREVR